jgi:hypothetical protein
MKDLNESSLTDLYDSAVAAFPRTRKRQHAVDPIVIESLHLTPFLGMRTLFIKAEARNQMRHYNPIILLKNINYDGKGAKIQDNEGVIHEFDPLSLENTDVVLRCNCPDFRWRFNYYDHLDHSLYGRTAPKYVANGKGPPANPLELPGMCKHLMRTVQVMHDLGIFSN